MGSNLGYNNEGYLCQNCNGVIQERSKLSSGHILIQKLAPNYLSGPECTPFTKSNEEMHFQGDCSIAENLSGSFLIGARIDGWKYHYGAGHIQCYTKLHRFQIS